MYKTTDAGANWIVSAQLQSYLRSVTFADSLRGWVGALFSSSADTILYETTDGGFTWASVTSIPDPAPEGICGLWTVSPSVTYGCGRFNGPPRVIKTTDGGATWNSFDLSSYASTLVDCYFTSADSGFVVGGLGSYPDSVRDVVLQTTDGGASWIARHTGSRLREWCWKISFPSPMVGYVSLERTIAPVSFLKTTDGGVTWTRKPYTEGGGYHRAQGIGFATELIGWIGGSAPANVVYETTDGGESWQTASWGTSLNRFRLLNDGLGYAVGRKIYKYDDNDPTFVNASPSVDGGAGPNAAFLARNIPNPFRSTTSVEYQLSRRTVVSVAIYDLAGARVTTLVHGTQSPGTHHAIWDGRDDSGREVVSGVYVCRLESERTSDSRRMLLLR